MPAQQQAPVPLAGESVYNLIPPSQQKKEQQRMYRSKFHSSAAAVPPTYSTFGLHGTSKVCGNVAGHNAGEDPEAHPAIKPVGGMGRSVAEEVDPHNFLKRSTATTVKVAGNGGAGGCKTAKAPNPIANNNSQNKQRSLIGSNNNGEGENNNNNNNLPQRIHSPVRAPVPTRVEKPVMGLTSGKNFVSENAREIAGAHPKHQPEQQRAVDLPDFGKVPDYLRKIKTGIDQEKALTKSKAVAVATAVDYDELSPAEVAELRNGLQRRLDELSKQIKSLPFKLETRTQIRRKEVLEQDFAAVETAMAKLSRKRILVMHDK